MKDVFQKRVKLLEDAIQKSRKNVSFLTENLEKAKADVHKLNGHLEEVKLFLAEYEKIAETE